MKTIKFLTLIIINSLCVSSLLAKPEAQITFHVVTDDGRPVQNAQLEITMFDHWQPGEGFGQDIFDISHIKTDNNGNVIFKKESQRGDIQYNLYQVLGYYNGGAKYQFKTNSESKWQPWNPTVELIVKPIINPIPMYAQAVRLTLPARNTAVGYDLKVGDLVAPYGKGTVSDFIFTLTDKVPFVYASQPYDVINTLSFSNKGDGIQSLLSPTTNRSQLLLPRFAPVGGYGSTLVQELSLNGDKRLNGADGENQNYFYRVRTVLDEQGNVKSALYGKISGPVICGAQGVVQFTYYLNPNPNDRNMEFDPTKNLFQNLTDDQQVKAP